MITVAMRQHGLQWWLRELDPLASIQPAPP